MSMVDERLYNAAKDLLEAKRRVASGEVVVAAAYLSDGDIALGSHFEGTCDAACLCAETGPVCTANVRGLRVVASICLLQDSPGGPIRVLAPCGICQERLRVFGTDVHVAVALPNTPNGWQSIPLSELTTVHWTEAIPQ